MLRKNVPVHLLFAPNDAGGGGGTAVADPQLESDPSAMGEWMKGLGELEGSPAQPQPAQLKKEPVTQPGAEAAAKEAAAKKAQEEADAAAKAKAAEDEAAKAAAAKKTEDEDPEKEKWPRNQGDWERFKQKRAEREGKLNGEIKSRDEKLQAQEARIKELEQSAGKNGDDAPAVKEVRAQLEAVTKERDELSERLIVAEVTSHPKFQAHFDGRTTAQVERAKLIVGSEKADAIEAALKLPEGKFRDQQLEEILTDLAPIQQARIGAVLENLDAIKQERAAEIKKAGDHRNTLTTQSQEKQKAARAQRDKLFETIAKQVQDPKEGIVGFKPGAGTEKDPAWVKAVNDRVAVAKAYVYGDNMKPEQIMHAAFQAAAFPAVIEAYKADMAEKNQKITSLEEQVKKLTAAQPKTEGAAADAGQSTGDAKTKLKDGMNPHEAAAAFADSFGKAMAQ